MESKAAQLRRRYPTKEKLDIAIKSAGSKTALATGLGMTRQRINNHLQYLNDGVEVERVPPQRSGSLKTNEEIDVIINDMFGGNRNEVKVYRMTEDYVPGNVGYKGLIHERTYIPESTIISCWARSDKA